MTLTEEEQFYSDIICTAAEGGSNYWLACERVERDADLNYLRIVGPLDAETMGPFDDSIAINGIGHIDFDTVKLGIARLLKDDDCKNAKYALTACAMAQAGLWDDIDYDATVADLIIQEGLFGDVVFS